MRILGVVTLVSPLGEYGGPTRVAVNQLTALRERGHDVVLTGSYLGYDQPPRDVDGVPARLFPARTMVPGIGFAGLAAPGLWRAIRRHAEEFDVVHVHGARDLVTLPAASIAMRSKRPVVLQTHGMIDESNSLLARPFDAALVKPVIARAHYVAYLTQQEKTSLEVVSGGRARLVEVVNGVPFAAAAEPQDRPHILYLARLAPRKRPGLFVDAAAELALEFPDARFTLVGPDEGEGKRVADAIASSGASGRIQWIGAVAPEDTLQHMRGASAYVLPSVNEPYPMSVLEAMSVGLPVIVTDTCGLASFVADSDAGIVTDASRATLVQAMRTLLADSDAAQHQGARGREAVRTQRSMEAVAMQLEQLYD